MPVITMTREMGSLGKDVAIGLAEAFRLDVVQRELVENVADKLHMRESSVNRFLEGKANLLERWGINENAVSLSTVGEILDFAAQGNVLIRGWGATHALREVPHVLRLRVCAPAMKRAEVLMDRINIEDKNIALREIEKSDAAHTQTMMHLFHTGWEDPLLYDLVLNTAHLSVDDCIAVVKQLLATETFRETPESLAKLNDMRLRAKVRAAIQADDRTNRPSPTFEVDIVPGTGQVVLSGAAFDHGFSRDAESVVLGVEGVVSVDNQLLVIPSNFGP